MAILSMIKLDDVTKEYKLDEGGGIHRAKNVSLTIKDGDFLR